jgi:uncharacterized protein YlxP (DUF503 family)
MVIAALKVKIHVPWASSLKDKRTVLRSLSDKLKRKFNISIAEVEDNDVLRIIVLGLSVVSNETSHAENSLDTILRFIEDYGEGEVIFDEREFFGM